MKNMVAFVGSVTRLRVVEKLVKIRSSSSMSRSVPADAFVPLRSVLKRVGRS